MAMNDPEETKFWSHGGICAICLDTIVFHETALIKGCEHGYCISCILRWASYKEVHTCPQCKRPFTCLEVHRSIDGSIHDYMMEESVCLLLRAPWFHHYVPEYSEEVCDDPEDSYFYDDDEDFEEEYYSSSSSVRIGNRRWGRNGYVQAGHLEARPVQRMALNSSGASSSHRSNKAAEKDPTGRRAKRAQKREATNKAAEAKHQQHLSRLGRN